jgi:chorismate mutase
LRTPAPKNHQTSDPSLGRIRRKIDRIDGRLIDLLARRFALAGKAKSFKPRVRDHGRESEILGHVRSKSTVFPGWGEDFIVGLFKEIMRESRRVQRSSGKIMGRGNRT